MNERLSIDEVVRRMVALIGQNSRAVILIDGRSGSGKSSLAAEVVNSLTAENSYPAIEMISMEELYAGWTGLEAGSETLFRLLEARAVGQLCEYQMYDWAQDSFGATRRLDPLKPWLIEGCGAITAATVSLSDLSVWIELDAEARSGRVRAREDEIAEWWPAWNTQHDAFIDREGSPELATFWAISDL